MDISTLTLLLIVFVLACIIGYYVIWGVTPALHTPLMAVTNAISGIVIVAAMLVAGAQEMEAELFQYIAGTGSPAHLSWAKMLGFLAVVLAAINIFGGFTITRRMLAMFKRKGEK
jgi:NAD(P) transhydrogenase subunit alpha